MGIGDYRRKDRERLRGIQYEELMISGIHMMLAAGACTVDVFV
jgi:hypothetical protein